MVPDMPEETRKACEELLRRAEPYPEEAPELGVLDGDAAPDRLAATMAKRLLDGRIK